MFYHLTVSKIIATLPFHRYSTVSVATVVPGSAFIRVFGFDVSFPYILFTREMCGGNGDFWFGGRCLLGGCTL